ncbi:MAG TPA: hypothetical protein VH042_03890 [Solirubrobacterales bacterium]|nr:hypothetical protein [Solirubrobacterales bacterium]
MLAAALLAACGGSDSDSNSSSTATGAAANTGSQGDSSPSAPQKSGSQGQGNGQEQDGGQSKQVQAQQASGGSRGRKSVETPLEVSGGGSGQFRTKGGDNSIQEFGDESDESELQEAAEVVHGFYVARAAEEWDKACSYLAQPNVEQLEKLANQSAQSRGADCAGVLKAFTRPLPASVEREITTVDAGSLRREGEQGFLIYYGAGHVKYAMPLREEGGSWKVTALSGTTLS